MPGSLNSASSFPTSTVPVVAVETDSDKDQIMLASPIDNVNSTSKSFAFKGTKTTLWTAPGARSNVVVDCVAKHGG